MININAAHGKPLCLVACAAYALTISLASSACALTNRTWSSALQTTPAGAGIIPGSWDRVQRLQLGSPLVVTLKSGVRLEGAFNGLAQGELALTDPAGQTLTIARLEISRIVTRVDDTLTNGALTGGGIGLAAALAVLAAAGSGEGYVLPSAKWGAPLLLSGVGIVVGMLVDRAHKGQDLIYVTP
jgi:hypothetical protein